MKTVPPLKILKASAGSGKTFSLTIHYLTLLLNNENSYREILAVTFTNKATAEMKERILSVLQGLAEGNQNPKIVDFRNILLAQSPEWTEAIIQEKAHQVYRRILHDYSHFTVSTIDGFSQKVIRSFTYELHLDAGYKVEMNINKVKAELTVMLNQLLDDRPDLLEWIIEYAEKKIANNENWNYRQQLLSLAGLIFSENFQEFDAHILKNDARKVFESLNQESATMTTGYTDALAEAIRTFQDIYSASGIQAEELKGKSRNPVFSASKLGSKVSNLSNSQLKERIEKFTKLIDHEDAFTDQQKQVRYDLMAQFRPVLQNMAEIEKLFPTFVAYQSVQANLYFLRLLKEMSDLLARWRKENSAQLISDSQLLLSKLGLDAHNDPTFIWEKIGNRFRYFLFDEFQDTSRTQWKNYSPLLINALGNATRELSEHLIVGDVKQSIYRWRNGDWRILLQQVEEQVGSAFHLIESDKSNFIASETLDVNYRSLPHIIQFNNHIYAGLPTHLQQVLNAHVAEALSAEDLAWWHQSGNDRMLVKAYENSQQAVPAGKQRPDAPQGEIDLVYLPVTEGRFRSNRVAADAIQKLCEQIGEWISSGKYRANQIGILVRRNKEAQDIIQALMAYKQNTNLSFEVISGDALSLQANDAIQLLIETLRAIVYGSDKHSVHKANMAYLYQILQNQQAFDQENWLLFKENDIQRLHAILPQTLIEFWDQWPRLPLVQLIERLMDIFGFSEPGNLHIPYLLAFKDLVAGFSANGERGIHLFLTYWEEDGYRAVLPSGGKVDAIEVTTVHKSKGLAYDVVMIPFAAWNLDGMTLGDFWINADGTPFEALGKIPLKYTSSLGQSLFYKQYFEEMLFNYMDALNTCYVATTRAIKHLYITAPFFKETVDKKTGEINGLEIKNDYISDAIYQVLDVPDSPFVIEESELRIHDLITTPATTTSASSDANTVSIAQYPISAELDQAWSKSSRRPLTMLPQVEKAAQYGIMAHEILSEVANEQEIEARINQYIEEGILAKDDQEELRKQIHQVWHHPRISEWLTPNYKTWNEASIITKDGETIRPDKVFTNATDTIVLDFKFTQGDYVGHQAQVDKYMQALRNLGYQNVKGFLYYALSNQLQEVV
ncbi:UvrD-helicase domain-containing protein [Sphingobacterium sp. lm-10]|uniref:UvrD-helicase domain-containing protein n=1 Tax=Sphingobacterium sp. lm-10 TaxID=2944904 RepID=UPI002020D19B|nr:UvrD-helicase domain-containing protein [Sphingobacterium sp. lm-10]MCL7989355.1 UvrD-helicase domain-containing protein [Sphingobacterium sp. lm-10]